jgi:tRNA pseudouridine55 synthase
MIHNARAAPAGKKMDQRREIVWKGANGFDQIRIILSFHGLHPRELYGRVHRFLHQNHSQKQQNTHQPNKDNSMKTHDSSGWLWMDKPDGISSTALGSLVKRKTGYKKIGHLGTLDPFASGVLILAVGEATKLMPLIEKRTKTYVVTVRWGVETDTLDCLGQVTRTMAHNVTRDDIIKIIPDFLGVQSQIPPLYSAVHVGGVRAYQRMRQGDDDFSIPARSVMIHSIDLLSAAENTATLSIVCETGTYIRSLVRDMAAALGTVGHALTLRRTADGAIDETHLTGERDLCLGMPLQPVDSLLADFPRIQLSVDQEVHFRHGRALQDSAFACLKGPVLVYGAAGLLGYGVCDDDGVFKPKRGLF